MQAAIHPRTAGLGELFLDAGGTGDYRRLPERTSMNRRDLLLLALLVFGVAPWLTGCVTFSEDHAPGGIKATETGMNLETIKDWQDRTIRQLAY